MSPANILAWLGVSCPSWLALTSHQKHRLIGNYYTSMGITLDALGRNQVSSELNRFCVNIAGAGVATAPAKAPSGGSWAGWPVLATLAQGGVQLAIAAFNADNAAGREARNQQTQLELARIQSAAQQTTDHEQVAVLNQQIEMLRTLYTLQQQQPPPADNTALIVAGIVVAVLVVGGAIYLISKKK